MKKHSKSLCLFLMAVTLCLSLVPVQAQAAAPKKTNAGIRKICRTVNYYLYIDNQYGGSRTTRTIQLTPQRRVSIAAMGTYIFYNSKVQYKDTISTNSHSYVRVNTSFVRKYYRNLFGKSLNVKKKLTDRYSRVQNGKVYSIAGDAGLETPMYKIQSIRSLGKGKYRITMKNRVRYDDDNTVSTVGTTWITVKKTSKSSYGYAIQQIETHMG